jgi:hypothetical protein
MVNLPGITTSWTRNPLEEWLFRRELPAHGREIYWKKGYSVGNYKLLDEESTRGVAVAFCRELLAHRRWFGPLRSKFGKILRTLTLSGSATPNPIYYEWKLLKKLTSKKSLKGKINLIPPCYKLHIYWMKLKKDTKILWDYPFKCRRAASRLDLEQVLLSHSCRLNVPTQIPFLTRFRGPAGYTSNHPIFIPPGSLDYWTEPPVPANGDIRTGKQSHQFLVSNLILFYLYLRLFP